VTIDVGHRFIWSTLPTPIEIDYVELGNALHNPPGLTWVLAFFLRGVLLADRLFVSGRGAGGYISEGKK
jgi:hypothetical protein